MTRRSGLAILALMTLLVVGNMAGQAAGYSPGCGQIPIVGGIPPWGFHTGAPITGATGSYARGHGHINLDANTVSGIVSGRPRPKPANPCDHHDGRTPPRLPLALRGDVGFPGNIMKITLRVRASSDPKCKVGTVGRATLFASYNGVRSDSVQFFFPAACRDHDHLYHGRQVNNQVPPL